MRALRFSNELGVFNAIRLYEKNLCGRDQINPIQVTGSMSDDSDDGCVSGSDMEKVKRYSYKVRKLNFDTENDMENAIWMYESMMIHIPTEHQQHDTTFLMSARDYRRHTIDSCIPK